MIANHTTNVFSTNLIYVLDNSGRVEGVIGYSICHCKPFSVSVMYVLDNTGQHRVNVPG